MLEHLDLVVCSMPFNQRVAGTNLHNDPTKVALP